MKLEQKLLHQESSNDTANNDTTTKSDTNVQAHSTTTEQSKTDDLIKLQQKITKEILNSNLKETEMNELQVIIDDTLIA